MNLQVVGASVRPKGRAGKASTHHSFKSEEGFNNEHPNAKKAAQMKVHL